MAYTVTQEDRRAGEMWRSSYGRAGTFQDLLEAFARHRIETLERAAEVLDAQFSQWNAAAKDQRKRRGTLVPGVKWAAAAIRNLKGKSDE